MLNAEGGHAGPIQSESCRVRLQMMIAQDQRRVGAQRVAARTKPKLEHGGRLHRTNADREYRARLHTTGPGVKLHRVAAQDQHRVGTQMVITRDQH